MEQELTERVTEDILARARANQLSSSQCALHIRAPETGKLYWKFLNREDKKQTFDQWGIKNENDDS